MSATRRPLRLVLLALALAACAPAAPPEPAPEPAAMTPAPECDACTLRHRDMARMRAVLAGDPAPAQ